jgi:glycosyltransferase involved in cell wall biosynthesis
MNTIAVIPCYNAGKTIKKVLNETNDWFDGDIICCDDFSTDNTREIINDFNVELISHQKNSGYGANQKSLYNRAIEKNVDIVVMIHGDYQYTPKLAETMSDMIRTGLFDVVFGSRILSGSSPLKNGMPLIKFVINRLLTLFQNLILGSKLSEFHSGYRAYSIDFLKNVPFNSFNDDFSFDNQMLVWAIKHRFIIGEISCPTKYDSDSSSIGLIKGSKYALQCIIGTFY